MRNLSLVGKIVIFKVLAISIIVFLAQVLSLPNRIIEDALQQIQKNFSWNYFTPKIKHDAICKEFKDGGLKNGDITSKVVSLQCWWMRKLYDQSFHEWKIIPLYLINKAFGKNSFGR